MSILLSQFDRTAEVLAEARGRLDHRAGKVRAELDPLLEWGERMGELRASFTASEDVFRLLKAMPHATDAQNRVRFGSVEMTFIDARLFAVTGLLSMRWSLVDRIAVFAVPVLCHKKAASNSGELIKRFVRDQSAAPIQNSIRQLFGWPISLSYSLRNVFVHDGGILDAVSVFKDETSFQLRPEGWSGIASLARARDSGSLSESESRSDPPHSLDLLELLEWTDKETGESLCMILAAACAVLSAHVDSLCPTRR